MSVSDSLVNTLAETIGIPLACFKRHIVEGESTVTTIQGSIGNGAILDMCIEGVVLVQMRNNEPPNINAELLLFSRGERLGTQRYNGRSYLLLDFDSTQNPASWTSQEWINDGPDDWEAISQPRTDLYGELKESWEDND
ncbi:hypothetical protein [uncultured Gimesia sp.]|uniref:hypothetical protein n=1 Tax=uncultured Gimesia sp. TaxID=1678688 RepID=UPI00261EB82F|nr:hypothetical protein [uncultured Gimesia sp.]